MKSSAVTPAGIAEHVISGDFEGAPHHVGDTGARVFVAAPYVVKVHISAAGFRRERDAWRHHPEELRSQLSEIFFSDEDHKVIVGGILSGTDARALLANEVDEATALDCATRAGEFIGAWQRASVRDDDPLPLRDAMHRRLDAALRTLDLHAKHPDVVRLVEAFAAKASASARDAIDRASWNRRVACHRDYRPRNWLYDAKSSQLSVIDFEHARHDDAHVDLVRSISVLSGAPGALNAFINGWVGQGHALDPDRLEACQRLHAVQTLAWAARHDDATYRLEAEKELSLGEVFDFGQLSIATDRPTRK